MAERTAETLAHILDAIAQIDRFTAGMTLDNYRANAMAQRAVELWGGASFSMRKPAA